MDDYADFKTGDETGGLTLAWDKDDCACVSVTDPRAELGSRPASVNLSRAQAVELGRYLHMTLPECDPVIERALAGILPIERLCELHKALAARFGAAIVSVHSGGWKVWLHTAGAPDHIAPTLAEALKAALAAAEAAI